MSLQELTDVATLTENVLRLHHQSYRFEPVIKEMTYEE